MLLLSVASALVFSTSAFAQSTLPAPSGPTTATNTPSGATAAPVESEDLTTNDQPKSNFSFQNEDMAKVLESYSRMAGVKIVIDPSLRGRITILNPHPVTLQQAFDDLSLALSLESYGFSRVGDTLVVRSARNLQRGLIEVRTQLPPLKPERMVTYVLKLKNIPAMGVNRDIRILLSKDGELVPDANSNSLIISDWTSNLHRVHNLMLELDVPANAKMKAKNAAATSSSEPRPALPPKSKTGN
ncbi:MAG: hypothetical protein KF767_11605 [Bdellovibrionaceae bacterium]|nr:hypothetical protein [Pseudobdellovibrionaceae bacterium]